MKLAETLMNNPHLPFALSLLETCDFRVNWHNSIELIYCMHGFVELKVNDEQEQLFADDFYLLNRYDIHEMIHMSDNALILVLRFNPDFYAKYYAPLNEIRFESHPSQTMDALSNLDNIKALISKLILTGSEASDLMQLKLLSASIQIFENIILTFKGQSHLSENTLSGSKDRLSRIIQYIDTHSSDPITLNELASREYVTPHYLSKYFKSQMGMNFSAYLSQVRLHKSMPTLMGSTESILNIALAYGFPNAKSYSQAFKKHYKTTPHVFRKTYKHTPQSPLNEGLKISKKNQEILYDFIEKYQRFESQSIKTRHLHKAVDLTRSMPKHVRFNKVIYFDFVYDGLNSNWQNKLLQTQKSLGFEYIKFKGIFTSGMYYFDPENNWYNWFNVDNLMDFFIQQRLKPFIELTFSPSEHTLTKWHELLESFLNHCLERYGAQELNTWNFELSSEDRRYESAIQLYTKTLKRLKKKFPALRLGILFIPADDFEERDYLINFRDKDLRFMSVQISEDTYNKKTALCQELFYNIRIGMGLETYVIFTHSKSYWNDTCYMSTKTVLETLSNYTVDVFVPFMDNIRSKLMFQGNDALVTYNGLQKPMFNASVLLNKLKGKLIEKGDNYFIVKKSEQDFAILLYNHLDPIPDEADKDNGNHMKYMQLNQKWMYEQSLHMSFDFHMGQGHYESRVYSLNSDNGSIFDAWIQMGAPENLNRDDMRILRAKEEMHLHISKLSIQGDYSFDTYIRPGEVKLIELKQIKIAKQ